jgi:hypothetical protein
MPHNTIEYFKAVAEKRQDSIQAGARFEIDGLSEAPNAPRNEDLRHPTPTDQEQLASHPRNSSSATDRFAIFDRQNSFPSNTAHDATTPSVTVTRQALEDPFVTPVRKSRSNIANQISFTQHNIIGNVGSMDFSYEFPSQGATSTHLSYTADTHPLYTSDTRPLYTSDTRPSYTSENAASQKQIFIQREQERLESMRRGSLPQDHYDSRLADVRFGEETVSGFQVIESPPGLTLPSASISSEDAHDRQKLKNKLIELGASEFRPNKVPGQRNAVPELHTMPAPARNLFPPPGLTVANPNRVVSTLNANAKPYIRTSPYNQAPEEAESETTVVNHQFFTRHSQSQEISNDLGHQAPTPQAFKGPFFTNDMLKTHNPAPSLPFLMDEPAKLQEWFHDGERPARQQEYANSIMATADVDAKARNCQKHGTIGDTTVRDPNRYANTPAFVRLYENLLQYAEESHVGETKDPFARAFKPAPPHLCDLGPNGNDSFFEYGLGSASPQQTRSLNKGQKSSMQQNMSSFGSVDAWPPINAQGGNLGGIFGGPNAKRY